MLKGLEFLALSTNALNLCGKITNGREAGGDSIKGAAQVPNVPNAQKCYNLHSSLSPLPPLPRLHLIGHPWTISGPAEKSPVKRRPERNKKLKKLTHRK